MVTDSAQCNGREVHRRKAAQGAHLLIPALQNSVSKEVAMAMGRNASFFSYLSRPSH
jgi:hypothetical protein